MKKLSSIALWIAFIGTIIFTLLFFIGDVEEVPTATGTTDCPVNLDGFLYWIYAVVAIGVVVLLLFAIAQLLGMFKTNPKGALATIGTFVAFFALLGICYAVSNSEAYYAVVNGSPVTYTVSEMKMVDMWLYSSYVMFAIIVLLIAGFGVKRLLSK
jgi:hypothetical protein